MDALFSKDLQGFQDRGQGGAHQFLIKFVSKALEIDTGGLEMGAEFFKWLGVDVAGGMADVDKARRPWRAWRSPACIRRRPWVPHRCGRCWGSSCPGRPGRWPRGPDQIISLLGPGLGNFPVLAEFAVQVTAGGGDGIGAGAGENVKERLLFDGIDMHGGGVAIGQGDIFAALVFPDAAFPPVAVHDFALPGAEIATDIAVGQKGIMGGGMGLDDTRDARPGQKPAVANPGRPARPGPRRRLGGTGGGSKADTVYYLWNS